MLTDLLIAKSLSAKAKQLFEKRNGCETRWQWNTEKHAHLHGRRNASFLREGLHVPCSNISNDVYTLAYILLLLLLFKTIAVFVTRGVILNLFMICQTLLSSLECDFS